MTAPVRAQESAAVPAAPRTPLRRACACGTHTPLGGDCGHCRKNRVQAKFAIGAAGDALEREADAVADRVMGDGQGAGVRRAPVQVQRQADRASDGADAPPSVDRVLARSGAPLDAALRRDMEARFGQDFSQVRTHTDASAAQSAQDIDAAAYTAGHHVVFGRGRYAPATTAGRHLIAHELTHVLQQAPARDGGHVRRKGVTAGGFFGNLFRAWRYPPETLQAYLRVLDESGDIEDDHDSDDKARQIANDWAKGTSDYVLTQQRKALLIREMQSGATGDSDELAILELLERSHGAELAYIFGAGGVSVAGLEGDFHGAEYDALIAFFDQRFQGGHAAAAKGTLTPWGRATAPGTKMPMYSNLIEQDIAGGSRSWNVPCVLGILCSQDRAIVDALRTTTVQIADFIVEHYWEFDGAAWQPKQRTRGAAHGGGTITLKRTPTCAQMAQTLFHEIRHHGQPGSMSPAEHETDAYTAAEQWTIDRGLPGRPELRQRIPGTMQAGVDPAAVDALVKSRYSGAAIGTPGDRVVGHAGADAKLERPDGTPYQRPARKGESHQDVARTGAGLANLPVVEPKRWVCPTAPKTTKGASP